MGLIEKIRAYSARRAVQRRIYAEMASMSDAELQDLDLSFAKIEHISWRQAHAA